MYLNTPKRPRLPGVRHYGTRLPLSRSHSTSPGTVATSITATSCSAYRGSRLRLCMVITSVLLRERDRRYEFAYLRKEVRSVARQVLLILNTCPNLFRANVGPKPRFILLHTVEHGWDRWCRVAANEEAHVCINAAHHDQICRSGFCRQYGATMEQRWVIQIDPSHVAALQGLSVLFVYGTHSRRQVPLKRSVNLDAAILHVGAKCFRLAMLSMVRSR